jgi:hypothetical protein
MPPRPLSLAIVLFWLGTTGYLFWHDLWPQLAPGQPPPFTIDLVEEAQTRRPQILWTVEQNGERVLKARTKVEHPEKGVYVLVADLTPYHTGGPGASVHFFRISEWHSRYRVTPEGRLLSLNVWFAGGAELGVLAEILPAHFTLEIEGKVVNHRLTPRVSAAGKTITLPTAHVGAGGSVLLPMHPVNRIRGLRPGQRWTMPVLDPLEDSGRALLGHGAHVRTLVARVRPELEEFDRPGRQSGPCLVIDYTGDDMSAQTWVEEKTGLVLRQDATLGGTHWAMYRE